MSGFTQTQEGDEIVVRYKGKECLRGKHVAHDRETIFMSQVGDPDNWDYTPMFGPGDIVLEPPADPDDPEPDHILGAE